MTASKRSYVDDDGSLVHIISFANDSTYDRIEIRHDPDDETKLYVRGYEGETTAFTQGFERRELSFDPISAIGRGETDNLEGVSETSSIDELPSDISAALNSIGMAPVPQGEWWLNE